MKYSCDISIKPLKNSLYCVEPDCIPFSDGITCVIKPKVVPPSFTVVLLTLLTVAIGSSLYKASSNALSTAVVSSVASALSSTFQY